MNFKTVDDRGDEEIEPKTPIKISLRELTEDQAKQALKDWTGGAAFQKSGIGLFGAVATKSWTFAILSDLKDKVHEIQPGRLEWVLRTALPLRDDFSIHLDGAKLGVRPSNRRDNHITSCCAPTMSVAAFGDGHVGVPGPIEPEARIDRVLTRRGDTA